MAEKVIHEYRLIETDDGFRIEIRGDKEELRNWMKGGHRRGPWGRRRHGFGPYHMGFPGMKCMTFPGDFTVEIEEEEETTSED